MTPRIILALAALTLSCASARAEIVTETITYDCDGTTHAGYFAYDDAIDGPRPGVMVVHEWWGLNDYAKSRAEQLAALGYVALAVDMYGNGIVAQTPNEAAKLAAVRDDKPLLRRRANAGLNALKKHPRVDPQRTAAIGYCFGGTVVLELAYSGADLAAVVSFHGGITAPTPQEAQNIKASILILHGAADPHVKPAAIDAFTRALASANTDWQFISYSQAVHGFTNPNNKGDPATGVAYNERADKRSWQHMRAFFDEIFHAKQPNAATP